MSARPRKIPEAYRAAARAALRAGRRIERTARHLAWASPAGEAVITASTPGGPRTRSNDLPELRRPRKAKAPARRKEAAR